MDMAAHKIYLVDLENIGTHVLYQHINEHKNARYIIFHSDSTSAPENILANIPEDVQVSFVDCHSGGNNAMDFCICTMAGMLAKSSGNSIRILSNDKGYDAILYMLHQRGVRIARESTSDRLPNQSADPVSTIPVQISQNNAALIKAIRASVPKQYQEEVITTLSGRVTRQQAHEMLQAILPTKLVADTYRRLKKHIPKK